MFQTTEWHFFLWANGHDRLLRRNACKPTATRAVASDVVVQTFTASTPYSPSIRSKRWSLRPGIDFKSYGMGQLA